MEQTFELIGFGFPALSVAMGWVRGVVREILAIFGAHELSRAIEMPQILLREKA